MRFKNVLVGEPVPSVPQHQTRVVTMRQRTPDSSEIIILSA